MNELENELVPNDVLRVRLAGPRDMEAVYRLAHDTFVAEKYCPPHPSGLLVHHSHLDVIPETTVLIAERGGLLQGTLSLTTDSFAGLHCEPAFSGEVAAERTHCLAERLTLGAAWRIATRAEERRGIAIVAALLTSGFIQLELKEIDRLLCMFNPRHERAWHRLLGLATIAKGFDPTVSDAPAVLMAGDVAEMRARWWGRQKRYDSMSMPS